MILQMGDSEESKIERLNRRLERIAFDHLSYPDWGELTKKERGIFENTLAYECMMLRLYMVLITRKLFQGFRVPQLAHFLERKLEGSRDE